MNKRVVKLGAELFHFADFTDWCDTAKRKFQKGGVSSHYTLCLDAKGRVCATGSEFMRARDEKTFPVRVYSIILSG